MDSAGLLVYGLAVFLAALFVYILEFRGGSPSLNAIPTIGPSGRISSFFGAIKFIFHAQSMVQEGYEKYKGGVFKVPMLDRWLVVMSGPELVDALRKVPDEELSFDHAMQDLLQVKYTFGFEAQDNPYHVLVIRNQLKRNLTELFPEVIDEIKESFHDLIPDCRNEWVGVQAYSAMMTATCRTSNRLFVGLPLCRSADFADVQSKFALQVVMRASLMNFFPKYIHPVLGRLLTNTPSSIKRCMELLHDTIEERLSNVKRYGDHWLEKPNDTISWLIDVSSPEDRNLRSICLRILVLNFASLHTSAQALTHALLHLATHPKFLDPLREEAEAVIDQEGWTTASMKKLYKLDSFLKESQRLSGTSLLPMVRKAMKPFTLGTGVVVPAGTHVAVASIPMHLDEEFYPHATEFDPFRFADMRSEEGQSGKHELISTSLSYIPFGQARMVCRFFASNTMKAMMAYLVINYDIKLKQEGVRPPDQWFQMNCSPNRTAEVMFRKRQPHF
ncbi:cytochrome P450 [Hygrophoropsis aurantiaca]|uniref:Cytochrome P450 n=1 Tax=Hygrophoropsis aurantiaca TaxID=72124 RepID=A0ACB8APC5_9AGAM|nr:cytochrome P450 [Hygrophoropsis aurantiaca]